MEPLSASSGLNPALQPVVALQGDLSVKLQEGRVLSGEVLQRFGGDSILLEIGSERVAAETQVELEPGQRYLFRAERKDGRQLLRILPDLGARSQAALFDALRALVGEERPLGSLLTEVAQALRAEIGADPARVAAEILRGGLAAVPGARGERGAPAPEGRAGSLDRAVTGAVRRTAIGTAELTGATVLEALREGARVDATLTRALAPLTGEEAFLVRIAAALRSAQSAASERPHESLLTRLDAEAYRPNASGEVLRTVLARDPIGYDATLMAAAHESGRDDRPAALRALTDLVHTRLDALGARPVRAELALAVERALGQLAHDFPVHAHEPLRAPLVTRLAHGFAQALRAQLPAELAPLLAGVEPGALLVQREGVLLRALLAGGAESRAAADALAASALEASTGDLRGALTAGALELEPGPLRELLGRAVAALDLDALLNLARRELGDAPHLAFAVPDGGAWTTVDLFLPRHGGDGHADHERDESFRLTLAVDFSRLGPIRADLLVQPDRLAARIVATDPAVAQDLRLAVADLEALLSVEGREVHLAIVEAPRGSEDATPRAHDIGLLRDHHLMDLSG